VCVGEALVCVGMAQVPFLYTRGGDAQAAPLIGADAEAPGALALVSAGKSKAMQRSAAMLTRCV
jgi:hypothetical protein